jgi:hypothetical protein
MDSKRTEQINGYLTQYSISAPTEANLFSASYQQWRNTLP